MDTNTTPQTPSPVRPAGGFPLDQQRRVVATRPAAAAHHEVLAAGIGHYRNPDRKLAAALAAAGYDQIPEEVIQYLRERRIKVVPAKTWAELEQFIEDSVLIIFPDNPFTAAEHQRAAAKYVSWCRTDLRLPLDAKVIWDRKTIDIYTTQGLDHLQPGTRRNERRFLDNISRVLVPENHPHAYTPQSEKSTFPPYSVSEMIMYRTWATGQTNPRYRRRAMLMLALSTGAGLQSNEFCHLYKEDIEITDDAVFVNITQGRKPRRIPVIPKWAEWLVPLVESTPNGELLWGQTNRKNGSNLLSAFVENAQGDGPSSRRLRNTWMVWLISHNVPLPIFFEIGGFQKMEHLGTLCTYAEMCNEPDCKTTHRGEGLR